MRLIAFYLPQFHPIPENDAWWGKGFTEWTSVTAARPLFPWHEQPCLPGELGFYDLRVPETRQAQADLAREHGIEAFCYHHYWFGGRILLGRPLDEVLASGEPDFPFCLSWANENWTRAWDGRDGDVLLRQEHSEEDDRNHFRWLARAFRDPRYVRVNGRPLFLVYRTSHLPDPVRTAAVWRAEARALGVPEPLLCSVESHAEDRADPRTIGFDAAVEFQPDWLNLGAPALVTREGNRVFDYPAFVRRQLQKPAPDYRRFPCVTPGWDNSPRRRKDAVVLRGATPEAYEGWLAAAVESCRGVDPEERLLFLNSWNEWAEGAQVEPDRLRGRDRLEATRRALEPRAPEPLPTPFAGTSGPRPKVSVCIPTRNGAAFLAGAIRSVLAQTLADLELIVVDDASTDGTEALVRDFSDGRITFVAGPERLGIAGNWNRCLALATTPYVCLFHQDDVMAPGNLEAKVEFLERHPRAGMVFSDASRIDERGATLSPHWDRPPEPAKEGLRPGEELLRGLLSGPNPVCAPGVVARREVFEAVGPFDPRFGLTLDWEMWIRIASRFDVGYLGAALVAYREHPGMETRRFPGPAAFGQAVAAKLSALSRAAEWLPDAPALAKEVRERSGLEARAHAAESLRSGRVDEAGEYLRTAVGLDEGGPAPAGDASVAAAANEALARLPEQPYFWEALKRARPVDVARGVTARTLVRAIGVKLAARPGFGWMTRLLGDTGARP